MLRLPPQHFNLLGQDQACEPTLRGLAGPAQPLQVAIAGVNVVTLHRGTLVGQRHVLRTGLAQRTGAVQPGSDCLKALPSAGDCPVPWLLPMARLGKGCG